MHPTVLSIYTGDYLIMIMQRCNNPARSKIQDASWSESAVLHRPYSLVLTVATCRSGTGTPHCLDCTARCSRPVQV